MTTFPTGKPHISFSEVKNWHDCGWRHKLIYIDKINLSKPSENLEFGTAVHAECEDFLKTRVMNPDRLEAAIRQVWQEKSLANVDQWIKEGKQIIADIPSFMDSTFPEWTCISSEHALYENIEGQDIKFKGFIDAMIKAKSWTRIIACISLFSQIFPDLKPLNLSPLLTPSAPSFTLFP